MNELLSALLGVIAGGIVTGGVQTGLARLDRSLASRTAARLLYVSLQEANGAMRAALKVGGWHPADEDWSRYEAAWVEHRAALARVVSVDHFLLVSFAFVRISRLAQIKTRHLETEPPPPLTEWDFTATAELIREDLELIEGAAPLVYKAALTRREKRKKQLPPARP